MADAIEAQMHFPIDTTMVVFSRSSKVDSNGYSDLRMTFSKNGDYSSISKKGKP